MKFLNSGINTCAPATRPRHPPRRYCGYISYKLFTLPRIRFQLSIPINPTLSPSIPLAIVAHAIETETALGGNGSAQCLPRTKTSSDPPRFHIFSLVPLFHRQHILSSPHPVSLVQMAGFMNKLNDRAARSVFGRYFRLEGSGHPKARKGARFTTEIRGGLTTFSSMVHSSRI